MKSKMLIFGLVVLTGLAGPASPSQKPASLAGTWSGTAILEGVSAPNVLTLVLELKEGKLAGTMSDEYGTIDHFAIREISFENGVLSFETPVLGPGGAEVMMKLKMTVAGDEMKGPIEIPDMGMVGTWTAKKNEK
jgi:hypothetical protein